MQQQDTLLDPKGAARILGVSVQTVRNMVTDGRLSARRSIGLRSRLIRLQDLRRLQHPKKGDGR